MEEALLSIFSNSSFFRSFVFLFSFFLLKEEFFGRREKNISILSVVAYVS